MEYWVFGSNTEGRHGAGAARYALLYRGARYGQARGPQGNSYAIVTKELRPEYPPVTLEDIAREVKTLLDFARNNPQDTFTLTPIGTGLAGFQPGEIAPLFKSAPRNVILPLRFKQQLGDFSL